MKNADRGPGPRWRVSAACGWLRRVQAPVRNDHFRDGDYERGVNLAARTGWRGIVAHLTLEIGKGSIEMRTKVRFRSGLARASRCLANHLLLLSVHQADFHLRGTQYLCRSFCDGYRCCGFSNWADLRVSRILYLRTPQFLQSERSKLRRLAPCEPYPGQGPPPVPWEESAQDWAAVMVLRKRSRAPVKNAAPMTVKATSSPQTIARLASRKSTACANVV